RLIDFLENYFKEEKIKKSINLYLLSEMNFGSSGSFGALACALASALLLFQQKNNIQEQEISFLALKIYSVLKARTIISPGPIFACLKQGYFPVYFLNENQNGSLDGLFPIKKNVSFPFDFYLLQLGEQKGGQPFSIEHLKEEMGEINQFNKNNFEKNKNKEINNFWEDGLSLMRFLSSKVLFSLGRAFTNNNPKNNLRDLFQAIDQHQVLFLLTGFLSKNTEAFSGVAHYLSHLNDELGCGVKSISTTKKDNLLLVLPSQNSIEVTKKIIDKIEKDLKKEFLITYGSSLDGLEKDGLKTEQFLKKNIFSQFVSAHKIILEEINQPKQSRKLVLNEEEYEKRKKQIPLLKEKKNLFIFGKKLTSKQIHSTKQTIELLDVLLKSPFWQIKNQALSPSAYSKDRYLLQSKITIPLIKAFKKMTQYDLPLVVSGSISNFTITLKKDKNLTIWLVR
ncbi:hypothetical protein FJ208_02180, partial [Candidatus Gribaldobacteria bacterium]|nr:hypothetical protein [Candidatus Gribaldobacteria bacterium]